MENKPQSGSSQTKSGGNFFTQWLKPITQQ